MKIVLTLLALAAFLGSSFAAPPRSDGPTIRDLNVIPARVLQRSISPKFYQSLLISPVGGWVVVRAQLVGTKLAGVRVIRSDLDGAYDALALKLANELKIAGNFRLGSQIPTSSVLLHLLIYKIADGNMTLSFASLDGAGDDQLDYFGCAKLAILQGDGRWTEIKGPASLHGKGMVVRPGLRNDLNTQVKLERIEHVGG